MKGRLDNGKGFLKDRFDEYRADPPEEVWALISSQLGRGNRKRMYVVILSVAATIALAVTLGITLLEPEPAWRAREAHMEESGSGEPLETGSEPGDIVSGQPEVAGTNPAQPAAGLADANPTQPPGEVADANPAQPAAGVRKAGTRTMGEAIPAIPAPSISPAKDELFGEEVLATTCQDEDRRQEPVAFTVEQEDAAGREELPDPLIPEEENRERGRRWALAAVVSPQYSYRDAENQATAGLLVQESGQFTYAGGINISYSPASRLAIESGVFFNRMGIDIDAMSLSQFESTLDMVPLNSADATTNLVSVSNTVGNIVTKSGDIFVNNYMLNARDEADLFKYASSMIYSDQGIRQQLDYLEVPFNLRFTLIDREVEVQIIGGISTNLLINSHVVIETASGSSQIGYLTNIRNMNYTGNAGLGMIYHIAGNFSLRLEPRFRYFLNSINDASLPSTRPYSFGLFTGMSYRF